MNVSTNRLVSHKTLLPAMIACLLAASLASADHDIPHSADAMKSSERKSMKKIQRIGLEGYCPVCVIAARKWERGRPEFQSTFDGVTYYFPSAAIKRKFDAAPAKYVPALGGDCTVCYAKAGKRVPGNIRHAAIDNNRLFLFPGESEKRLFQENPQAYANVDLAANGECVVCLAKANKHVPGKPEHTVVHNGFRYQFPSDREANAFRKAPEQFIAATMRTDKRVSRTSMRNGNVRTKIVSVAGMSACAGCEFGVTPLADPDELGLAVKTSDGGVVVVENAHKLYPEIYAARFQGQSLQVEGEIVKTEGKIAWVKPSAVRVVN